jgi:hypothetical protein
MTRHKTFKLRVRERMTKTGESYTAARRMLIADGDRPVERAADFTPPVSEAKVVASTGRGWQEWFAALDAWEATRRGHTEIARWLREEHAVDSWYAQSITVGYEQARGLRAPGEHANGFAIGATKTMAVPVERLFAAFVDEVERKGLLPDAVLRLRTATAHRSARFDWEDGETRVNIGFDDLGPDKSRVSVSHERLPDADTAAEMKTWWRGRLVALKSELEGSRTDA